MLVIDPIADALRPDGYPLINAEAKLLFLNGGHYCLQYREGEKEKYKFLSPQTVKAAFQNERIDSGWIPDGIQRLGSSKQGDWFVRFMPPRKRTFNFIGAGGELETLTIPMIGLVFMLSGTNCYIWGTTESKFNPSAPIYHVPLPNIYQNGTICMGSENNLSSNPKGLEMLDEAWETFVNAPFNNHLVDGKSNSDPEDIRIKLRQLQNNNRYPINDLVQCGKSVEVAINMVIHR